MHAHKQAVTIAEDHRVEVRLPENFPAGPAEVIVLTAKEIPEPSDATSAERRRLLDVIQDLKSTRLTSEEELILDEFENFRAEHPFRLSDLSNS
jgi:hypothetical protein